MNRKHTGKLVMVLGAIVALSIAAVSLADEPAAKPKVKPEPVPAGELQAAPQPKKKPLGKVGAKKPVPKPLPAESVKGKKVVTEPGKKPLIAPPGLLSQAHEVVPVTRPGLGKINLNRCKIEDIQRLPGVGLVWAPRILAGRPYRNFGDLARTGVPFTVIEALSREVELGPWP